MNTRLRLITALVIGLVATRPMAASAIPADSLVIRFANRTRLVIYAPDKAGIQALANYDLNKIVREMGMQLDSLPDGKTAISREGDKYLKDTVLVIKKKDGVTIEINRSGDTTWTETIQHKKDYTQSKRKRGGGGSSFDYGLSIGLSNFLQQSVLPVYPENSYALRPIGSRYLSLAMGAMPTLVRGKRASLKLYYGLELAWTNFMFDADVIPERTPTGIAFTDAGRELRKSKLTVCTIGIPVVPRLTFYNSDGRRIGHIGLGGYVNYRIDSYRKIKEADGSKDRRHSNFDLADYRYGLMAHLGIKSANFFVKYDLSPLFVAGKGPDVRVLTFGIGL
ncbi:hypothetical protein [Spirosoma utsteinense]|uniref:Outer membrane protein beta-barrel domain-containing protein n=1 Tax=Spirosoma utsteinense TaxID=2585773 RepID=A0ABR6W4J3_9BACT|nr:hypothetical protein [Spirosoma utsteinense]MBC3785476.1 hypothetical protein [Spirosoma utsteinense]MBC3791495.1 hypothetical protein [Spirosoma utsteinense]